MPKPLFFAESAPQGAGSAHKGALDEKDDSLLILRGGVHRKRFASLRVEVRPLLFGLVASILTALAGWLYLEQATRVIEQAHEILLLEQKKEDLTHEVVILKAEIARLGALHRLLEEGERVQYRLPKADDEARRLYLQVSPQATALMSTTTKALPAAAPPQPLEHTWPQKVIQWFGALLGR